MVAGQHGDHCRRRRDARTSRGVEAFARVAAETKAFEVVGPPLAESVRYDRAEDRQSVR
jgi:hypothetical protein